MSTVQVVSQTQRIDVAMASPRIVHDPVNTTVTVLEAESSVSVTNAGPPGPAGPSVDTAPILDEVNSLIAAHNQTAPIHQTATSGRDFVAVFQNGLI